VERLPGLYIPPLPNKKIIGSTKDDFVAERCYLLDKFVKNVTRCPYLFESEEFRVFLHPEQELDKQLEYLQPNKQIPPGRILKRYKNFFELKGYFGER
jgi:hypothetical protein